MYCKQKLRMVYSDFSHDKISRDKAAFKIRDDAISELRSAHPEVEASLFYEAFTALSRQLVSEMVISEKIRVDGRKDNQLRNISCQIDLHEPLHGSALFQRGQTQVMCTVALGKYRMFLRNVRHVGLL